MCNYAPNLSSEIVSIGDLVKIQLGAHVEVREGMELWMELLLTG